MTIQDKNGEPLAAVPYFVHEMEMTRLERIIRRLTHAVMLETLLLIIFMVNKLLVAAGF